MDAGLNWRGWLSRLQSSLGHNRVATRLAVKVQNQAHCIISHALGEKGGVGDECNSERWLIRQFAQTAKVFVDVGANQGDWTALFLREAALPVRGLLFEPIPELAQALQARFQDHPGIEIIDAAVSDQPGHMDFYVEPGNPKMSSLAPGATTSQARKIEVAVTTLDDAVNQAGVNGIDLLKIDAEGYDLNVIKGARRLLARGGIKLLQFEYGGTWVHANNTLAAALAMLRHYAYGAYLLRENGLYRFDYQTYGEFLCYSNFVAVSPAMSDRVTPLVRGEI
jgi:FkbM family methyltransferase